MAKRVDLRRDTSRSRVRNRNSRDSRGSRQSQSNRTFLSRSSKPQVNRVSRSSKPQRSRFNSNSNLKKGLILRIIQSILGVLIIIFGALRDICEVLYKIVKRIIKDERPIVMGLKYRQIIPILLVIVVGLALVSTYATYDSTDVQPVNNSSNDTVVITQDQYGSSNSTTKTTSTQSNIGTQSDTQTLND